MEADSVQNKKACDIQRMYKYAGKNYFRRKKDYEKSTFRSYGFCYGTGHGR